MFTFIEYRVRYNLTFVYISISYFISRAIRLFIFQEGMGQLRIVTGGIQLSGQAMVLDALIASSIRSRRGQPITVESSRNFTVNTRDGDGRVVNRLFLGESSFLSFHNNIILVHIPSRVVTQCLLDYIARLKI